MGMFDTVICEYLLPLPKEAEELKSPPDWKKLEFQTRSMGAEEADMLGGFMDSYAIEDDGQIYKDVIERTLETDDEGRSFVNEKNNGIEKVNFTGDLIFYAMHQEKKYDYWIEFSALFWKGDLKEIELNEWKKEDNSKRVGSQKKLQNQLKKIQKTRDSRQHKIKEFIKKPIRYFFYIIKFLLGLIVRIILWLERKIL